LVDAPVSYVTAFLQPPYYVPVGKRRWFVSFRRLGRSKNEPAVL